MNKTTKATFAAGCFWCIDTLFRNTKGVKSVASGYSGGDTDDPKWGEKKTGHAESVQIEYNPDEIGYDTLLEIFWTSHNPTTPNQDGANIGPEYRSVIFYHNDQQKKAAKQSKSNVATQLWDDPIVTEIVEFKKFWLAEEFHQDFYRQRPFNQMYCTIVINPKLAKFKERFAEYVRDEPLIDK